VGQLQESAEERLLAVAVLGDLLPPVGPGDDGAGGDDEDVGQLVESLLAVSIRGSGRSAKTAVSDKGIGCPPDALGVVRNSYTVSGS
jgi:hypothetical protein